MTTETLPERPGSLQPRPANPPASHIAPQLVKTFAYRAGLILLAVSAACFFLPGMSTITDDTAFGLFGINFLLTAIYGIMLLITGAHKVPRSGPHCVSLFLLLFLISAYALNRSIPVFEDTVTWFGVLLVASGSAYLSLPYLSYLPLFARQVVAGILGLALMIWLYLSCYLVPLYPISIVAAIGLGLSLHSFVPALLLLFTLRWAIGTFREDNRLAWGFSTGAALAIILTAVFTTQWSRLREVSTRSYQHSLIDDNVDLPAWVKASRTLQDNWATEPFLKGDLVYTIPQNFNGTGFWGMPSRGINETRRHDPLVMMASLFTGNASISAEDRIRMLESKYDARHRTEERLWSGANLRTTAVITNAHIWPARRIAYTEQIFTVSNKRATNSLSQPEEAIYSFQLPEGSAVTSLSLWIDGKESKGILTTRGKAQNAYRQIVGVENRDPSVVQWAEGNRVSVRVFPVIAGSNRVFKIGVTTPLVEHDGKLVYKPMRFEGPQPEGALATTQLRMDGPEKEADGLKGFTRDAQGRYRMEGDFNEGWSLKLDAPRMQPASFSFNGATYALQQYTPQRIPAITRRIYLDLNGSWSRSDYEAICKLAEGYELYAGADNIVRITGENKDQIFKTAKRQDFSLFPLFAIEDPASALLITQSGRRSPHVKDLQGSGFGARLEQGLKRPDKIRLFNLGAELSPYLKSLKEHRAFRYERGNAADLQRLLNNAEFAAFPETDNSIVLDDAGLRITRTAGVSPITGPDHIQRLFAYNHILRNLGENLYKNMEGDSSLIHEASEAYVVSPISSLVVLESVADYERFDIRDKGSSLRNASVNSNGAVPEPHEWALIFIGVGVLIWLKYRPRPGLVKISGK